MSLKYRVAYHESERGWGSDDWTTDYNTEKEALDKVKETNDKYCSTKEVPAYYIRATYMGPVTV